MRNHNIIATWQVAVQHRTDFFNALETPALNRTSESPPHGLDHEIPNREPNSENKYQARDHTKIEPFGPGYDLAQLKGQIKTYGTSVFELI